MWWSVMAASALAAAPAEDLMARVVPLGPNVVLGVALADNAAVGDLRRLDALDPNVALTIIVVAADDDPSKTLPRAAVSVGSPCAVFATRGTSTWTLTTYGACAPSGDVPAAASTGSPVAGALGSVQGVTSPVGDLGSEMVPTLVAMRDWPARRTALVARMATTTDAEDLGRIAAAMAVANSLEAAGRTDPSIVKLFLQAAFSTDSGTRQAAMDAARANGDPPMASNVRPITAPASAGPTPPESTTVTPHVADPTALRDYARRRFVRDTLTVVAGSSYLVSTQTTWSVYDGKGAPIPALSFARAVKDQSTLDRMDHQADVGRAWAIGGCVAGTAGILLVAAGATMQEPGYDFQSDAGAAVMYSGAAMIPAFGLIPAAFYPAWQRRTTAARYYSTTRADTYIEAYNLSLRESLSLTEADVAAIDLAE